MIEVLNNSTALEVPSFTVPHSATTVSVESFSESMSPGSSLSRSLTATSQGKVAADVSWTRGSRRQLDRFNSSLPSAGAVTYTVSPDATGTVSAVADWQPTAFSRTQSGYVADLQSMEFPIQVGSTGTIRGDLTYPPSATNAEMRLSLIDPSGVEVASAQDPLGAGQHLQYQVTTQVPYPNTLNYKFVVTSAGLGKPFDLSQSYPVTARVDVKIKNSSGAEVAASTLTKPASASASSQPPGTYTVIVSSRDYAVPNLVTDAEYSLLAFAPLTVSIKQGNSTVTSTSSATGNIQVEHLAEGAGNYTLVVHNDSNEISAPSLTGKAASHTQVYPDLDLELLNASGSVIASSETALRPESITYPNAPAGSYTLRVVSRNWQANYDLDASYKVPALATVTARFKSGSTILKSVTSSSGHIELDHFVPQAGTYTLELENTSSEISVPSFTGTVSVPTQRFPDLDLELWNSSGVRVAAAETSSRPESITFSNAPAGSYTLKAVSKNFAADYSLTSSYQVAEHAPVTVNIKTPGGEVLDSQQSSSGSVGFSALTQGGGNHTIEVVNNSSQVGIPSFQGTYTLKSTMTLELTDVFGNVVSSDSTLTSPNSIMAAAQPAGRYVIVATPTGGSGSATVTATFAPRVARQVIGYDANDHANYIDDGTNEIFETLSPSGRVIRRVVRDSVTDELKEDTIFGYSDEGDSPSYSRPTSGGAVTSYIGGSGGLSVIDTGGVPSYQIQNLHGDVIGTTDAQGSFTANPETDEFGVGGSPSTRLGWLGGKERFSTGSTLGFIRMGVRLYDPALGRFLSVDPVEGGSANDYDYANQDCVNGYDLDGRAAVDRWLSRWNSCMKEYDGLVTYYTTVMKVTNPIPIALFGASTSAAQWGTGALDKRYMNRVRFALRRGNVLPFMRSMAKANLALAGNLALKTFNFAGYGAFAAGLGGYTGQSWYCGYAASAGRIS